MVSLNTEGIQVTFLSRMLQVQNSEAKLNLSSQNYPINEGYKHIRIRPVNANGSGYSHAQLQRIDTFIHGLVRSAERRADSVQAVQDESIQAGAVQADYTQIAQEWLNAHNTSDIRALQYIQTQRFGTEASANAVFLNLSI